jgi:excisionase family DNA binding protein
MANESGAEYLNVREAARRLGVHENTVRNWAASGRLHAVAPPGSRYRKFDAAEVDRVALEQRGVVGSIQDSRRALGRELVDATLLDAWADRLEARSLFPKLIRALLAATPEARDVSARAGEGVGLPGWDALVEGGSGSAWVPAGHSAWEFGTGSDPSRKAQDDIRKRTKDPLGVDPLATTFVFATPRRWPEARDWERRRRKERKWQAVRALDADDLEGWLGSAPAVHIWISEELGLRPRDVATIEEWWQRFASRTLPAMPIALLLAGRESESKQIEEVIKKEPEIVGLQASSRDEAVAFLAAVLHSESDKPATGRTAIVVSSGDVWHRLANAPAPSILVPMFEGADLAAARAAGHHVIVPFGAQDVSAGTATTIRLARPGRTEAREAFEATLPFDRADRMAVLARRSMASLLRALAVDPRASRPSWGAQPHATSLAPLVLVGTWSASEADQAVVSRIVGRNWDEIEREITGWTMSEDPPLINAGGAWRLSSPQEAFLILEPAITLADFKRWQDAAIEVLGEINPVMELPSEERPFAALQGQRATYSSLLRGGVSQGLALLGAFGDRSYDNGMTGREHASLIVRDLLDRANADESGLLWFSLSPELPMLAEAAPQVFLDAVNAGLVDEQPVLARMFQDAEGDPFFSSSSPHTGLLWALEKLCWSPEFLLEASTTLARLTEVDPGGRLGNRPPRSLRTVFLPWIPRTSASAQERLVALNALRLRHPSVAWQLMMALLPTLHDTSSPTTRPKFRDWQPDREGVTVAEWGETIVGLVDRAIEDADENSERWANLTDHIGNLPTDQQTRLLTELDALDPQSFDPGARLVLWRGLTQLVSRHRSLPDAKWVMDDSSLKRLEAVASRMEPADSAERHARLFDWHPDLPGVNRRDHDAYERALTEMRFQAAQEALSTGGVDGLRRLAADSRLPGYVGATAADVAGDTIASQLLPLLGAADERGSLAYGWAARMASTKGREWITATVDAVRKLSQDGQASFLLALPPERSTWDLAEEFDEEVKTHFWKSARAWTDAANLEYLLEKLLDHGRVWAAIDLLAMHCASNNSDAHPPTALVEKMLRTAVNVDPKADPSADISGYEIGVLLDYLERAEADTKTLVEMEWAYFQALEHTRVPSALYLALADDPAFFVELVTRVYRGKSQRRRNLDERETALAHRAWEVLDSWRIPPGQKDDGTIDAKVLQAWVRQARLLLADADRADIGDEQIGQLLSGSLPGADGAWPAEAVRDLIETLGSNELESGLHVGRMNARGVTSRGPYDGGDQERSLTKTYRQWATDMKARWPRTARVLQQLADTYERDARRHDAEAELDASEG